MVILNADHPDIEEFINCKAAEEKKAWVLIDAGYNGGFNVPGGAYDSVDFQNANHSVRVTDEFMRAAENNGKWITRAVTSGEPVEEYSARDLLRQVAEATHLCGDPGLQFDTTINEWHTCINTDRIYASNPCSEFLFLDNTACNLASLNLMKFRTPAGDFDAEAFVHGCETFITAQEILVSNASYPTEPIARNSEDYRPLGLGYCNLGALLMAQGTAYDSDAGRALAGAITAIMTGAAYRQSAEIAGNIGAFNGYAKNREPMLRVIGKHRAAVNTIPHALVPDTVMNAAHRVWDEALLLGQKNGYRNAQATVLAPTGTISFMMDADTTGIEPDIALVKYKKLVGGGLLKIVNQTVPEALRRLGYSSEEAKAIIEYIDKNDTIEGAPGLRDEHLSVFDCAFKAQNGTRSIHHMGHVKMMAAAQPFISGAISKTVNMPEASTAEDIFEAYLESWKLGLKAVAIYRDNSKRTQPLSTTTDARKSEKEKARPVRRKLPDERQSITHKFSIAGQEGYFTVGLYDDGSPGELFIKMSKEGSTISGLMDSFAVAISLSLQYGVPLRVLINKYTHARFEPSGYTTNKDIPIAKSLMDYIFRWFDLKFHPNGDNGHFGAAAHAAIAAPAQSTLLEVEESDDLNEHLAHLQADAPPCTECGTIMVRAGACYKCPNCGTTSGCG
jgi:ribonucleoside-diphosphate reductase alpha chain